MMRYQKIIKRVFFAVSIVIALGVSVYLIQEIHWRDLETQAFQKGFLQREYTIPALAELDTLSEQAMKIRQDTVKLHRQTQQLSRNENEPFLELFDLAAKNVFELSKNPFEMGSMTGCIRMMLVMLREADAKGMTFSSQQKRHILQVLQEARSRYLAKGRKDIACYANLGYSLMSQRPLLHPNIDFWRYPSSVITPAKLKMNEKFRFLAVVMPIWEEYESVIQGGKPSPVQKTETYSGFFIRLIGGIAPSRRELNQEVLQRIAILEKSLTEAPAPR